MLDDHYYINEAFKEAYIALSKQEIPVGAVVVCGQRIIAKAHNQTEQLQDATAHAEMLALSAAMQYMGSKYLTDCTLYVTLEPCAMCAGACAWTQIARVVFSASDSEKGFLSYNKSLLHPRTKVVQGPRQQEAEILLKDFFSRLRAQKKSPL